MNKYKNALSVLSNLTESMCKKSIKNVWEGNIYQIELDTLQELVNKETPMKVTDIHVDEFYCPKCHSEISHDKYNSEHPKYCEECGQRLDWSDSE